MFNIRTSTSHKVYRFRNQKFWAEHGAVHVVDERTGERTACSLRDFLLRAKAMSDAAPRGKWTDERIEEQRGIEDMIRCAQDAKQQGDMFSVRVQIDKMRAKGLEPDLSPPDPRKLPVFYGNTGRRVGGTVLGSSLYGRQPRRHIDLGRAS